MGQLVNRFENIHSDVTVLNVSALVPGSYLLRIHAANGMVVKNFIVQ